MIDGEAEKETTLLWHEIQVFQNCCAHLRERSRQLAGEPILENHNLRSLVKLTARRSGKPGIIFYAVNIMTRETAFGLLHFCGHFRETAFDSIEQQPVIAILNQRMMDMLQPRSLRGQCLTVSSDILPTLAQLKAVHRQIAFEECRFFSSEGSSCEDSVKDILRLLTTAGGLCEKIYFGMKPELVDELIEVASLKINRSYIRWTSRICVQALGRSERDAARKLILVELDLDYGVEEAFLPSTLFSAPGDRAEAERLAREISPWDAIIQRTFENTAIGVVIFVDYHLQYKVEEDEEGPYSCWLDFYW